MATKGVAARVGNTGVIKKGFAEWFSGNGMGWSYKNSILKEGDVVEVTAVNGNSLTVAKGNSGGGIIDAKFFQPD